MRSLRCREVSLSRTTLKSSRVPEQLDSAVQRVSRIAAFSALSRRITPSLSCHCSVARMARSALPPMKLAALFRGLRSGVTEGTPPKAAHWATTLPEAGRRTFASSAEADEAIFDDEVRRTNMCNAVNDAIALSMEADPRRVPPPLLPSPRAPFIRASVCLEPPSISPRTSSCPSGLSASGRMSASAACSAAPSA